MCPLPAHSLQEVKALKRKFDAHELDAQRSTRRALMGEMDAAASSPRVLSRRWRARTSPLSSHNQQVQPGEGAVAAKAPNPAAPPSHQHEPDMLWQIRRGPAEAAGWGGAAPAPPAQAQAPTFGGLFGLFNAVAEPGPAFAPGPALGSTTQAAATAGGYGGLSLALGRGGAAPSPAPALQAAEQFAELFLGAAGPGPAPAMQEAGQAGGVGLANWGSDLNGDVLLF